MGRRLFRRGGGFADGPRGGEGRAGAGPPRAHAQLVRAVFFQRFPLALRPPRKGDLQLKGPLGLPRCTAPFPTKWWLWFSGGRRTLLPPRGRSVATPGRLGPAQGRIVPCLQGDYPGQRLLANSLGAGTCLGPYGASR